MRPSSRHRLRWRRRPGPGEQTALALKRAWADGSGTERRKAGGRRVIAQTTCTLTDGRHRLQRIHRHHRFANPIRCCCCCRCCCLRVLARCTPATFGGPDDEDDTAAFTPLIAYRPRSFPACLPPLSSLRHRRSLLLLSGSMEMATVPD